MPLYHDIIKSFKVLARDGTVLLDIEPGGNGAGGRVALKGGLGFTLAPASDGTAIDINADPKRMRAFPSPKDKRPPYALEPLKLRNLYPRCR